MVSLLAEGGLGLEDDTDVLGEDHAGTAFGGGPPKHASTIGTGEAAQGPTSILCSFIDVRVHRLGNYSVSGAGGLFLCAKA